MRLAQRSTSNFVNIMAIGRGKCTRSIHSDHVVVGFSSLSQSQSSHRSVIDPARFQPHSFQYIPITTYPLTSRRYFSGKSDDKANGAGEEDVKVEFVNVTSKKKKHVDVNDLDLEKFTHEVKVRMPDVGDSDGVVEKWYKKEGDLIQREDVICDIRTDLFTFGMMTDDEKPSIMGKIMQAENSEPFKEGTVICTTFHHEDSKDEK